jgi:hypothetical protein
MIKAPPETITWGSMLHHASWVEPVKPERGGQRKCLCGCDRRITHVVKASGIAMKMGCELDCWRFMRRYQKR